jgi:8-oxo-dGTP diphosphatase
VTDRFRVVPAAYVFLLRAGIPESGADEVLLQLRQNTGYMDGHWAAAAARPARRSASTSGS